MEEAQSRRLDAMAGGGRGGRAGRGGKGGGGGGESLARWAWRQYLLQLQLHPLRTKMITAGCLAGVSDLVVQKLSGYQKIEKRRLLLKMLLISMLVNCCDDVHVQTYSYVKGGLLVSTVIKIREICSLDLLFGFAYGGPFGHFLHKVLDYIFKGKKDTKTIAKKVLLEQITSSPWNNILFLFYYGYVVERRPFTEVKSRVRKQYPSVQLSAWMFWPIVGWINHQYMPLQFRVIFHSFVACCWGIFLNLRARAMSLKQS